MGYLPSGKIRNFSKDNMLEGALFKRWKLEENEGLRAHSKGGKLRKHTTLDGRELESAFERGESSKVQAKGGRVGNTLPLMVDGSKAHSKEVTAQRRTPKKVEKHRFFRWPSSHGRPAQVEKFSKMKNFQKQFQSLAISSWPST